MRRRDQAGRKGTKAQRRKTSRAPKAARRRHSVSAAAQQTKVAQITRELEEAREQQTATTNVLKVISKSTFDLQTVLETLVASAARLCRAEKANISLLRDGTFHYLANIGFSPELIDYMQSLKLGVHRGSITGRAVFEGKTIHVPDVFADLEFA